MSEQAARERQPLWLPPLWLLLFALAVRGFHATGDSHGRFVLQYVGLYTLPPSELSFYAWYGFYGLAAMVFATLAWHCTPVPARITGTLCRVERPWLWVGGAAVLVAVAAIGFRILVLQGEPVADDELTYRFIAHTLLEGRVVNEPPLPIEFLRNQFVITTENGWYGKYPIGHPLVLAVGELAHLRGGIVPVLAAGCLALTFAIGRKLFSPTVALVGTLLLAVSPQFVWTAGTELSQPTELFCLLLGVFCVLEIEDDPRFRWAVLGGLALGFAMLVRPLPGAPCVVAVGIAFIALLVRSTGAVRTRHVLHMVVAVVLLLAVAMLMFIANAGQSGAAMQSGYQTAHVNLVSKFDAATIGSSLGGALLRQSFWLFGIPLSMALVPFARPRRGHILFWGLLIAVYAYRVAVPKTVVSATGPIYVLEAVPFLCLATAAGLGRVVRALSRLGIRRPSSVAGAVVLAAVTTALFTFVPVQVTSLHAGARARARLGHAVNGVAGDEAVVVFANGLVDSRRMQTWAYYPPSPRPDLSDRVLYLRLPAGDDGMLRAAKLWQSEFPDRRAFVYGPPGRPFELLELSQNR